MSYFILNLIFLASIMMFFLTHPLSIGLILLIQTINIALITGFLSFNYWFSYIIFLIMIGGMLILFIYMTSIASNEKFKFSINLMTFFLIMMFSNLIIFFIDNFFLSSTLNSIDLMNQNMYVNFSFTLNKFLNWPLNKIFYLMIIYLLISLIMVVKITNINYGPLRQKL